jgi:hypothetical protein
VVHGLYTGDRAADRHGVEQVTVHELHAHAVERSPIAPRPRQDAYGRTRGHQHARDVGADEAGAAGDERVFGSDDVSSGRGAGGLAWMGVDPTRRVYPYEFAAAAPYDIVAAAPDELVAARACWARS